MKHEDLLTYHSNVKHEDLFFIVLPIEGSPYVRDRTKDYIFSSHVLKTRSKQPSSQNMSQEWLQYPQLGESKSKVSAIGESDG